MRFVEKKGKTVDEAVELALAELNASKDSVEIEVLEETKGLFGLLGSKEVKVRVTLLKGSEEDEAKNFLANVTEKLGMNIDFETSFDSESGRMKIDLVGPMC